MAQGNLPWLRAAPSCGMEAWSVEKGENKLSVGLWLCASWLRTHVTSFFALLHPNCPAERTITLETVNHSKKPPCLYLPGILTQQWDKYLIQVLLHPTLDIPPDIHQQAPPTTCKHGMALSTTKMKSTSDTEPDLSSSNFHKRTRTVKSDWAPIVQRLPGTHFPMRTSQNYKKFFSKSDFTTWHGCVPH